MASLMFGFGFALVPFYEQICKATGLRDIAVPDKVTNTQVDATRTVRLEFDANLNKMPWQFRPMTRVVNVHPGELTQVVYEVENTSERPMTGQAVPSYGPQLAGEYFKKLECFCFTKQSFGPHAEHAGVEANRAIQIADAQHRVQYFHRGPLKLDEFVVFLACAAIGARPVRRNILPLGARGNSGVGIAVGLVIDVAADEAHVFFHSATNGLE